MTDQTPLTENLYGESTCYRWKNSANSNLRLGNLPTWGDFTTAFSVSFWVKIHAYNGGVDYGLYSKRESSNYYCFLMRSTNKLRCGVRIGAVYAYVNGDYALELDTWYHVVHSYDGNFARVYVNGKQQESELRAGTITVDNTVYFRIGAETGTGTSSSAHTDGSFMEFRVYSRAITFTEVEYLYWKDSPLERNLRAYYSLNNVDGTVVFDGSKQHFDGLIKPFVAGYGTGHHGFSNTAMHFDGVDTRVELGNDVCEFSISKKERMTIAAYAKMEDDLKRVVFSRRSQLGENDGFVLGTGKTGGGNCIWASAHMDGGLVDLEECGNGISVYKWMHIAMTYDGTTFRLFRDGEVVDSSPETGELDYDNGDDCVIGSFEVSTLNRFKGWIEDVYIFSRALTKSEIQNLQRSETIDMGLITYFEFKGEVKDSSIQATTDSYGTSSYGGPTYGPDRHGIPNNALYLDGIDDWIKWSGCMRMIYPFTIMFWARYTTQPNGAALICKDYLDTFSSEWCFVLQDGGTGKAQGLLWDTEKRTVTSTNAASTTEPNFLAFSWDGKKSHVYVNSEKTTYGGSAITTLETSSRTVTIGRVWDDANRRYFNGQFDEIRMYRRALSAREIKILNEEWECFGTSVYQNQLNSSLFPICSSKGWCSSVDSCECFEPEDYFGEKCEVTKCFGIFSNDSSSVCTGRGICWPKDVCTCNVSYGERCNGTECFGVLNSPMDPVNDVCEGHGMCVSNDVCKCSENYYDINCNVTTCFSEFSNTTTEVCNGHGRCWPFENCTCSEDYYGVNCSVTTCLNIFSNESSEVCSGHGTCWPRNKCTCDGGYYGGNCSDTQCDGTMSFDSNVCSGIGIASSSCWPMDNCSCLENYFGETCEYTFCEGKNSTNPMNVCSGKGVCWPFEECTCEENYKISENCNVTTCDSVFSNISSVCYSHGVCWPYEICTCFNYSRWTGEYCNISVCFGISSADESKKVCSGHGNCISADNCTCVEGYDSFDCSHFYCKNISKFNDLVCNRHGKCTDSETCECWNEYNGTYCTEYFCFGIHFEDGNVCHHFGNCSDTDICNCSANYEYENDCGRWKCFEEWNNETISVCTGHGTCDSFNNCTCEYGYGAADCVEFKCGKYQFSDSRACSNHGECTRPDNCVCDAQYYFFGFGECIHCPNGTHFDIKGAKAMNECILCPAGTFSSILTSGCVECPLGTYSSENRTDCLECPIGTYLDVFGGKSLEDCKSCAAGYYGAISAAKSKFECVPCPQGTSNPSPRQDSIEACKVCVVGVECPVGSEKPFLIQNEFREIGKAILYEDLGVEGTGVDVEDYLYEFKFIVGGVISFLCLTLICCVFCATTCCCSCLYLEKGNSLKKFGIEKKKKLWRKMYLKIGSFTCLCPRCFGALCLSFKTFDCCYNMNHDISEGESAVKRSTSCGGVLSIIAVSIGLTMIIWSITDFVYGSKKISTTSKFFQIDETNQISGSFSFLVDFYGTFENCSADLTIDGLSFGGAGVHFSVTKILGGLGCACNFTCDECMVKKSDMVVEIGMNNEGEFVRFIRYMIVLPSFDETLYNVTGLFYEKNGTIDGTSVDIAIYSRKYETQSYSNLFYGLLDLDELGKDKHTGIGAGVLSIERDIVEHPGLEKTKGVTPFKFNMKLSNFEEVVSEYFPQTALNFIAQIFSLLGLAVAIVGIVFSQGQFWCGLLEKCCCVFCCAVATVGRKSKKIEPIAFPGGNEAFFREFLKMKKKIKVLMKERKKRKKKKGEGSDSDSDSDDSSCSINSEDERRMYEKIGSFEMGNELVYSQDMNGMNNIQVDFEEQEEEFGGSQDTVDYEKIEEDYILNEEEDVDVDVGSSGVDEEEGENLDDGSTDSGEEEVELNGDVEEEILVDVILNEEEENDLEIVSEEEEVNHEEDGVDDSGMVEEEEENDTGSSTRMEEDGEEMNMNGFEEDERLNSVKETIDS